MSLAKAYGPVQAVRDVSLRVESGEFVTLLGPSGSGKTTVLMMVAGLVEPTAGQILIDGRSVTGLPPGRRDIGVVFQHYALFPHLTVAENIAFPLRMRAWASRRTTEAVRWALELVRLAGYGDRYPGQLSGGEQQRVALARAVVFGPPLLLLDEPLGALDRKLRERMQAELRSLHHTLGVTIIHVTHDQTEALAMSSRVAVMRAGELEQVGHPRELYERPRTEFVADFLGESNFLTGHIRSVASDACTVETAGGLRCRVDSGAGWKAGEAVRMMVRPERVAVGAAGPPRENTFPGRVEDVVYTGEAIRYRIRLSETDVVTATVSNSPDAAGGLAIGAAGVASWRSQDVHLFPA